MLSTIGNRRIRKCSVYKLPTDLVSRSFQLVSRRCASFKYFFFLVEKKLLVASFSKFVFFLSFLFNFYSAEKYLRNFCIVLQKFNIFSPLYITDFNTLFFLIFIIFLYRDYFQFWLLNILIDRRNINFISFFFFLLIFVSFYEKEQ